MNKVTSYIQEAYNELVYKVTWPSWKELQNSSIVVLITSLLIALIVLGMDQVSSRILKILYEILAGF